MIDTYWKCEYENLRRKKNKEIAKKQLMINKFMEITWNLLKEKGMSDEEILTYYEEKQK